MCCTLILGGIEVRCTCAAELTYSEAAARTDTAAEAAAVCARALEQRLNHHQRAGGGGWQTGAGLPGTGMRSTCCLQ